MNPITRKSMSKLVMQPSFRAVAKSGGMADTWKTQKWETKCNCSQSGTQGWLPYICVLFSRQMYGSLSHPSPTSIIIHPPTPALQPCASVLMVRGIQELYKIIVYNNLLLLINVILSFCCLININLLIIQSFVNVLFYWLTLSGVLGLLFRSNNLL